MPVDTNNRSYSISISVTGANSTIVVINNTNVLQTISLSGSFITIPSFPSTNTGYVEIS